MRYRSFPGTDITVSELGFGLLVGFVHVFLDRHRCTAALLALIRGGHEGAFCRRGIGLRHPIDRDGTILASEIGFWALIAAGLIANADLLFSGF